MSDSSQDWPSVWRLWLKARFGDDLQGERLEAAVAECEAFRGLWGPLASLGADSPDAVLDNGELPFVHLLPPVK